MKSNKLTWLAIMMVPVFFVPGCEELKRAASADPNTATAIEGAAEAGVGILQALAAIWPGAAVGAGALGTALAAWRKAKGKLAASKTEGEAYYHTTQALVLAIDEYREANPDKWIKLKATLEGAIGPEAENIIRALRSLPPKA